jgi:hypothetical protein
LKGDNYKIVVPGGLFRVDRVFDADSVDIESNGGYNYGSCSMDCLPVETIIFKTKCGEVLIGELRHYDYD